MFIASADCPNVIPFTRRSPADDAPDPVGEKLRVAAGQPEPAIEAATSPNDADSSGGPVAGAINAARAPAEMLSELYLMQILRSIR